MSARAGAWHPRGIGARLTLLAVFFAMLCATTLSAPRAAHAQTCDQDGVHASFTTAYDTTPPAGFKVTAVTISGIDAACQNRQVTITLKSGASVLATASLFIAGPSLTIPLGAPTSVDNVGDIDVTIASSDVTPTPSPSPSPTPSPTPSPSPTPTESPTPSPTPTETPEPSPTPRPTAPPILPTIPPSAFASLTPAPTVLATVRPSATPSVTPTAASTGTPQPTPTPAARAATPAAPLATTPEPESTPPPPNPDRSEFASFIPSIRDISLSPATITTNLTLSLIAFLLILAACAVFNETLEENGPELTALLGGMLGPFRGLVFHPPPAAVRQRLTLLGFFKPIFLLFTVGLIYSSLDPGFGWNPGTLALLISMSLGLGFLTIFFEGGKVLVTHRVYHGSGGLRIAPLGIAVAVISVIVSRMIAIHPGIVFGFVAGAAVSGNDSREDGQITFLPMVALFFISMFAFLMIDPLRTFSDRSAEWWALIPETVTVTVFIGGIEGLLFNLLPLEFMEGKTVWNWSRLAWLGIAVPVGFVFFHMLVNRADAYEGALEQTSVQALIGACILFLLIAAIFWVACRFWLPKHTVAAGHGHH